jgi:hypothetical protein
MPVLAELVDGVIGVDTHRDSLAAAALSSVGGVLGQTAVSADAAGYQTLLSFADVLWLAGAAGRSRAPAARARAWPPSCAAAVSSWSRLADPSGRRSAAAPRPMRSTPSALPVTPSASCPSSWLQSASGATTRRCGCC